MDTTYHDSEEVATEAAFVKMIPPGLTILVECGLEGEHHAIQKLVKNERHGGLVLTPEPENSNWPVRWTPLLDAPKQQPGTRQEVLMRDFVQGPDSRVVCNPRTEIEEREPGKGTVPDRREYGLHEDAKGRPRHKSRQPEAEEPVGLRSGFWTRHTTTHGIKSEGQHGRRAVG
jgi:hypothetical protein